MGNQLHARVQSRDRAVLRSDGDSPYEGDADGGVVPDCILRKPEIPVEDAGYRNKKRTSQLQLRQTHEDGPDGWHIWSLSLEGADDSVSAVCFPLPPTFVPPVYNLTQPPFRIGPFSGWGTFDVKVDVSFASKMPAATMPVVKQRFALSFDSS